MSFILDLKFSSKLKYVQISVITSTFDRITKVIVEILFLKLLLSPLQDRAAKFVDQLSAIGGTMGLLTGFSLISAVEILYFMVKIVTKILKGNPVIRSEKSQNFIHVAFSSLITRTTTLPGILYGLLILNTTKSVNSTLLVSKGEHVWKWAW